MKLRIGTRGSELALVQTNWVASELRAAHPDIEIDVQVIKTKGDIIANVPLHKIGDKGLFVKEIEDALLDGRIDLSVNSMKDMPAVLPDGLVLSYCPRREDARDVLVTKHEISNLDGLPNGATIGTGSKRRSALLRRARADINVVDIRGNVQTRIDKIEKDNLDGVVIAMAGVKRLGFCDEKFTQLPLSVDEMVPAPGQGILALEIREGDERMHDLLADLRDDEASLQAQIERQFLFYIEGGCHAPTGAYAQIDGEDIVLTGLFGTDERLVEKQARCRIGEHENVGKALALEIKRELANG